MAGFLTVRNILFTLFLFSVTLGHRASAGAPEIRPGAAFRLDFPELPRTLAGGPASMDVRLPKTYDPNKRYPLFLWLNSGRGGSGHARTDIANPETYICIGLPLFRKEPSRRPSAKKKVEQDPESPEALHMKYEDAAPLWSAWSVMLAKLQSLVPSVEPEKGVAGGLSNGAHAIGVLLAGKRKEFRHWFGAFILAEGGYMLRGDFAVRKCPMLILAGEHSWAKRRMTFDGSEAGNAHDFYQRMKAARADAELIVMPGVGHDFPSEYAARAREWLAQKGW